MPTQQLRVTRLPWAKSVNLVIWGSLVVTPQDEARLIVSTGLQEKRKDMQLYSCPLDRGIELLS
jgi:hypothetical protein